jgi:hypothetical protein
MATVDTFRSLMSHDATPSPSNLLAPITTLLDEYVSVQRQALVTYFEDLWKQAGGGDIPRESWTFKVKKALSILQAQGLAQQVKVDGFGVKGAWERVPTSVLTSAKPGAVSFGPRRR